MDLTDHQRAIVEPLVEEPRRVDARGRARRATCSMGSLVVTRRRAVA